MLKAEICLPWLILSCGQVAFWWRRDNVFGYLQGGFLFATIAVPVLFTPIVDRLDPIDVKRYADILIVGALAYLAGLSYGASLGQRLSLPRVTFDHRVDVVPRLLVKRTRQVAVAGVGVLVLSFSLLGYIPFLAVDRVSAKYGVGVYAGGFARGSLFLHVGLVLASTVLPVALVLVVRNRRPVDAVLAGALLVGLLLTLSRQQAFIGPLVFLIALAIERRWRPWRIAAAVCFAFVGGALFNELVSLSSSAPGITVADRVAASAPDINDQVGFLHGYVSSGSQQIGLKPILASLSLDKGDNSASAYALGIRIGIHDIRGFPSGGLRLPAPLWGYASFGYPGVVVWSLLSGVAIGWGTRVLARALAPIEGKRGQALSLVLAWVFFEGTYQVLGSFYFVERVGVVSFALALYMCWSRRRRHVPHKVAAEAGPVVTPVCWQREAG